LHPHSLFCGLFYHATATPQVYPLSLHDALPILNLFDSDGDPCGPNPTASLTQCVATGVPAAQYGLATDAGGLLESPAGQYNFLRSEEHTSELQSRENLVCRLLLEKKKKQNAIPE